MKKNDAFEADNHLKEMLPLIETNREKANFKKLDSHQSQLKNEELFFRMMHRGS